MHSQHTSLKKLKKYLNSGEQIPHDLMIESVNEVTATMFCHMERAIVSRISEIAGKYLDSCFLFDFIKAELSDEEAENIIAARKIINSRFSTLIPAIVELLGINDTSDLYYAILRIYDCSMEYNVVKNSDFKKQKHKKTINEIKNIISAVENLDTAI